MTDGPVVPRGAPRPAGDDRTHAQRRTTSTMQSPWCSSEHAGSVVAARMPDDECERWSMAVPQPTHHSCRPSNGRTCVSAREKIVAELLADNGFQDALAALRIPAGNRIGVLGASMSFDDVNWVALLHDVLAAVRPGLELVDHCAIGCTTAEALAALPRLLLQRPDHILIMLGVDDACRHGAASGVLRVSTAETHRNLSALRAMAQVEAHVGTTLITPPPARPRREPTADSYWVAEDLNSIVNVVRSVDPEAVCLRTTTPTSPDYWVADGVHPSAIGHTDIVRRIVGHFSRPHQRERGCGTRLDAASCQPLRAEMLATDAPTAASRG